LTNVRQWRMLVVGRLEMEIIEAPIFTKRILGVLSDDEYKELQWTLIANPLAGSVIPGGNGLRKIRWAIAGSGKSGGLRIIYYYLMKEAQIYLILAYKKSEQQDLTKMQLKMLSYYVKEGVI
jgi:mRNA-degrading endonuclease RelE of RelBE toxin-antitoxin system